MVRFAANISMMFTERPFLERFGAAAAAGFQAVECHFPYTWDRTTLAAELARHDLTLALFNLPPGDWDAGERGLASIPGREAQFRASVEQALEYALALGCSRLHAMAGLGNEADPQSWRTYVDNLAAAADVLRPHGITLLIEAINAHDMPGYFLQRTAAARRALDFAARENLRLLLDLYHCQITEGDLMRRVRELREHIGHVQIAGVPGRHEPDQGEVDYAPLLAELEVLGYRGWVGCEYRPLGATVSGLAWRDAYLGRQY